MLIQEMSPSTSSLKSPRYLIARCAPCLDVTLPEPLKVLQPPGVLVEVYDVNILRWFCHGRDERRRQKKGTLVVVCSELGSGGYRRISSAPSMGRSGITDSLRHRPQAIVRVCHSQGPSLGARSLLESMDSAMPGNSRWWFYSILNLAARGGRDRLDGTRRLPARKMYIPII